MQDRAKRWWVWTTRVLCPGMLVAGCLRDPAMISAPRFAEPGPLVVRSEKVALDCGCEDHPVCDLRARYAIENPAPEPADQTALLLSRYAEDVAVSRDGEPLAPIEPLPLEAVRDRSRSYAEQVCQGPPNPIDRDRVPVQCWEICELGGEGFPESFKELCECPPVRKDNLGCLADRMMDWVRNGEVDGNAFRIRAGPGESFELELRARIRPGPQRETFNVRSPAHLRHFALRRILGETCDLRGARRVVGVDYLPASGEGTGGQAFAFEARAPARWKVSGGLNHAMTDQLVTQVDGPLEARAQGEGRVATLEPEGALAPQLTTWLEPRTGPFHPGGLVLVMGAGGPTDRLQLRAGAGYEIACPSWLLTSIRAETDFRTRTTLIPGIQAATPSFLSLPSIGLGVGVPVILKEDARVGGRVQLGIQFPVLGLALAVDHFPGKGSFTELGLFAVLSL